MYVSSGEAVLLGKRFLFVEFAVILSGYLFLLGIACVWV